MLRQCFFAGNCSKDLGRPSRRVCQRGGVAEEIAAKRIRKAIQEQWADTLELDERNILIQRGITWLNAVCA